MSLVDIPYRLGQNPDVETIGDPQFENPLRPYIRFVDRVTGNTNYIFDGFRDSNELVITDIQTEAGIGDTGSAEITILNTSAVNTDLINWGNKIILKMAKNQFEFTSNPDSTFLIGYVKGYSRERPATNIYEHKIKVLGSKVIFNERKINYKKSTNSTNNTKYQVKNHIKSILQDESSYPTKQISIADQSGFDLSGINDKFTTFVGKINYEMIEAGNAIDRLVNIEGGRWYIDYKGDSEIFVATYPTDLHTGVTIKSYDLTSFLDHANYTSWFFGHWNGESDITGSTGFANSLFTKTMINQKAFTSSFVNKSSTTLANKALAQKFFITETRITDVAFLLSKVGDPTSQENRVNGRIIADNNNSPTGNIISKFNIPLSSIEKEPTTVFVNDLDIRNRFVTAAEPAWLVLYQRSGTEEDDDSEPNNDELNTIRWHHNQDTSTTTDLISKVAAGGDRSQNLVWNFSSSSTTGPTYGFSVFAEIRHIQNIKDSGSIERYGVVEAEIDTSFLEEPDVIQTYMDAILYYSARPRLVFGTRKVKIPSNFLFKPYQIITLQDSLAYPNGVEAEVQRVSYSFDADQFGLGCRTADITPMGYYDYLSDQFKC